MSDPVSVSPTLDLPCRPWQRSCNGDGYGHRWYGKRVWLAHRAAWDEEVGPIPAGLSVLHHCDNPPCTEISHLYLGTQADNVRDRDSRGRRQPPVGVLNGRAKLSPAQVADIRRLAQLGVPRSELQKRFLIGKTQVARIVRNEEWR